MPDILMIQANHDMRNPSDFLVLHKLAKAIFRVPGISRVQGITRPEGTPIEHTSIPFLMTLQNSALQENMTFIRNRTNDMLKQADMLERQIAITKLMYELQQRLTALTHHSVSIAVDMVAITEDLRNHVADFQDIIRPIQSYFYWEKHCYDIPICAAFRGVFDVLDSIVSLVDLAQDAAKDAVKLDALAQRMLEYTPRMIAIMEASRATPECARLGICRPSRSFKKLHSIASARHEGRAIAGKAGGPRYFGQKE